MRDGRIAQKRQTGRTSTGGGSTQTPLWAKQVPSSYLCAICSGQQSLLYFDPTCSLPSRCVPPSDKVRTCVFVGEIVTSSLPVRWRQMYGGNKQTKRSGAQTPKKGVEAHKTMAPNGGDGVQGTFLRLICRYWGVSQKLKYDLTNLYHKKATCVFGVRWRCGFKMPRECLTYLGLSEMVIC